MVIGLLVIPSFFAAFAEDEGTLSPDYKFWNFFAGLFYILRFPTHTLLWSVISEAGPLTYLGGLFTNCIFYGLIIERLASLLPKQNKKNEILQVGPEHIARCWLQGAENICKKKLEINVHSN